MSNSEVENKYTGDIISSRAMWLEISIALLLSALAIIYAIWPLLTASGSLYPATVDGLGHLTRVQYLADCWQQGIWPSWFPHWYNGSTVTQYYPPLSFLILGLIHLLTQDITLTLAIFIFISQLIGAMGVWYFGYRLIGPWVGIAGAFIYSFQPYLLRMLLMWGSVAQGPIFALTPWFLFFTIWFLRNRNIKAWLLMSLMLGLLVLSQPMHAYIIAACTGIIVLVLLVQKQIRFIDLCLYIGGLIMGVGIMSFWVIPGVTHLEHPLVPYLLPGAATMWAAHFNWFTPAVRHSGEFYFSSSMLLLALLSLLILKGNKSKAIIISLIAAMVFSICFSFGDAFPLYRLLPMHDNLVTGRFLSFGVLAATILIVYVIQGIVARTRSGILYKMLSGLIIAVVVIVICIDNNPKVIPLSMDAFSSYIQELDSAATANDYFGRGRLAWISKSGGCEVRYLGVFKGYNLIDGWNIEGTPHNRTLWVHNVALSSDCNDYIIRNLLNWNTRTAIVGRDYAGFKEAMIGKGFQLIGDGGDDRDVLFNPSPPAYFLRQERNAIAIGRAASGLVMTFPWLIEGQTESLEDYSMSDLKTFELIYLAEPEVKDFNKMEKMVKELAVDRKTVIVEMGNKEIWPLLGVMPYWETVKSGSKLVANEDSAFKQKISLPVDPNGRYPAIGNLDEVLMQVVSGDKHIPALGYKNVGNHKVYFVGMAMSQNLKAARIINYGFETEAPNNKEWAAVLEQVLDMGNPNKNYIPTSFPVLNSKWSYDSFTFKYNANKPTPVVIAVTYTDRWRAKIDGKPIAINNLENLMLVKLPAGKHSVSFHYGMTWVGWLGIALSILSMIILILIILGTNKIEIWMNKIGNTLNDSLANITD